jgi:hypothetical protein
LPVPFADTDGPVTLIARPDRDEDRHLLFAGVDDFLLQPLRPVVEDDPDASLFKRLHDLQRIRRAGVVNRRHRHLFRREPQRQPAFVMLEQHRNEALHASQHGVMNHYRSLTLVAVVHVKRVEPLRQHEIELNCAALPTTPAVIQQMKFQLGTVERALAIAHFKLQSSRKRGLGQRRFGTIPHLVSTCAQRRAHRQRHRESGKSEVGVDVTQQIAKAPDFDLDLRFRAKDMRVVLHERSRPLEPFERT